MVVTLKPTPITATNGAPVNVSVVLPLLRIVKVRVILLFTSAAPKSVWLVVLGVVAPLGMLTPLPWTSISGAVPLPCTTKVYGFSSLSLLPIVTVAVTGPTALGAKSSWKVVLPVARLLAGWLVMAKAPALAPLSMTNGEPFSASVALPVLRMVKVRVTLSPTVTLPNSVLSSAEGVVSPLMIDWLLLCTSISGAMGEVPVP